MATASIAPGIDIAFETSGDPRDPAVLLVMGLTAQLTAWPDILVDAIVRSGRFVVRFDNRDCGLSTRFEGVEIDVVKLLDAFTAGDPSLLYGYVPYTLTDMAADAVGVLDHLGIEQAHVVGASLGGMIAQTMAIEHPGRLLSLTSIMSTTGELDHGRSTPEAQAVLLTPAPAEREAYLEHAARNSRVYSSKRYFNADDARRRAALAYDRAYYPQGSIRQLGAIFASGSREDGLRRVAVPSLVIHGLDDTLIDPSGGRRTAELIPNATLLEVADMGHDFPAPLVPTLATAIIEHTA